jgi:hypothetical protein
MATDFTKKMLQTIRENTEKIRNEKFQPLIVEETNAEEENFLSRSKVLMEEAEKNFQKKNLNEEKHEINDDSHEKVFPITKKTPQFGDVRVSQEEALVKTIGQQIKLDEDSLLYYPDADDLVLNGEIPSISSSFQFRYNDPSGEGVYIWSDGLQLTEFNSRTLGKVRDAYLNWRQGLINDGDLMDKLKKVADKEK